MNDLRKQLDRIVFDYKHIDHHSKVEFETSSQLLHTLYGVPFYVIKNCPNDLPNNTCWLTTRDFDIAKYNIPISITLSSKDFLKIFLLNIKEFEKITKESPVALINAKLSTIEDLFTEIRHRLNIR